MIHIVCMISIFIVTTLSIWNESDFEHHVSLIQNKFNVYWNNLENDQIEFGVECMNLGWCAIGISPNGDMINSDIMFMFIDDDTQVTYLQSRYTNSFRATPKLNTIQSHLTLIGGEQINGMTRIRFTRDKYPCLENENIANFPQGTTRLIYAFGAIDPDSENIDNTIQQHSFTNRGTKSINFEHGVDGFDVELEHDHLITDITFNNTNISNERTSYYCQLFKLPETTLSQHIIRFEPIITAVNEANIHHILLFHCPFSKVDESHIGDESHNHRCDDSWSELHSPKMPSSHQECNKVGATIFAWTIGGNGFSLPQHVGMEMSGTNNGNHSSDLLQYVMMQIHYDNPALSNSIQDFSGIRIFYTPTHRQYDAGTISTGLQVIATQFIPPGMEVTNYGHCPSACSEKGLSNDGVTIIGTILHAHNQATGIALRHIRNGKELEPINVNKNYDVNYQDFVSHKNEIILLPGDDLIVECNYSTTNKKEWTIGGVATTDEMCLVFLMVYPKPSLKHCTTQQTVDAVSKWLVSGSSQGYIGGDIWSIYEKKGFGEITWKNNKESSKYYNDLWYSADYKKRDIVCTDDELNDLLGNIQEDVLLPGDFEEWEEKNHCSLDDVDESVVADYNVTFFVLLIWMLYILN